MCIAALFIAAAPLSAQTSVGLGEYHDEFVTQVVIDARVATTAGWLTPNIIVSWDLHGDGKPVLLPQVGRTLISNFPVILGADVGVSAGPWDNYSHWEPHVSATAVAFLYGPLKVVTIYSVQPWNDYARAAVIKLDWTF